MQGGAAIVLPPRLAGSMGWIWMERSLCAGRIPYPPGSRRHGVCGRGMPLPYMPSGNDRPNGIAAATRANVGRDALIPPHPAAGQGSAGGINPAPTGKFCVSGKPGATMFAPVCRGGPWPSRRGTRQGRPGRYGIGPYMGCLRRRGVCGRGMPLPYMPSGNDRPNGIATAARANVGRDALIPPGPAAAGMFPVLNRQRCGGRERPPYGPGETRRPPGKCNPRGHCKPM